jgi:hypothetical protein
MVEDGENIKIYLDRMVAISEAVKREPKKKWNLAKLPNAMIAYDEVKRMLVLASVPSSQVGKVINNCPPELHLYVGSKVFLDVFVFDPATMSLTSRGSRINLTRWYDATPTFQAACFVSGKEEIFLLEEAGRGRIYSLITEQFRFVCLNPQFLSESEKYYRPAHVEISDVLHGISSTPDGSCLLLRTQKGVRAIHWATFGSNRGTMLDIPFSNTNPFTVTSLERRNIVYMIMLNSSLGICQSVALAITSKSTEFIFRAQSTGHEASVNQKQRSFHNCLIDCHADVWTRFPVVPAVERNILSTSDRHDPVLAFVTSRDHQQYGPYFREVVTTFKSKARKPTEGRLDDIHIQTSDLDSILSCPVSQWVSAFTAGTFLLEILCLIPIHIAVTRENRFLPLKDGVLRADFERQLLGASVSRIVDNLSFGWYESVFQSYMANKACIIESLLVISAPCSYLVVS